VTARLGIMVPMHKKNVIINESDVAKASSLYEQNKESGMYIRYTIRTINIFQYQYSLRRALPEKVAYFLNTVLTASKNPMI
jgi:hypothetical protein